MAVWFLELFSVDLEGHETDGELPTDFSFRDMEELIWSGPGG